MFLCLRNCIFGWKRHSFSTISSVMFLAFVSIFCAMSTARETRNNGRRGVAVKAVATSNLEFTSSIYEVLSELKGNVFFSPLSIEVILALAYMGAQGSTASQMARGLRLPGNDELTKQGFNALITSLTSDRNVKLEIANKIFCDKSIPLKREFQGIAQKTFLSDVGSVDFKNNVEAARLQINQWVESKTNKKIKDLLAPKVLDDQTSFVLVNAIYFKGAWEHQFSKRDTRMEPFFVTPKRKENVPMMHIKGMFGYHFSEDLDCEVLEMRYKGDKFAFVALLPNEQDGLADLEDKLPEINMVELIGNIRKRQCEVSMPKFKLEEFVDLNDKLRKLGMTTMFENSADFSGISETPVKVSKVVHKAFIEVNELGSEAAAATGAMISTRHMVLKMSTIKIDHPFTFFIYNRKKNVILFMGRMINPRN